MTVILQLICLNNMDALGLSIMSLYGYMGNMPARAVMLSSMNAGGSVKSFTIPIGGSLLIILSGYIDNNTTHYLVQPSMYTISDLDGSIMATCRQLSNGGARCGAYEVATISGMTITATDLNNANFLINVLIM